MNNDPSTQPDPQTDTVERETERTDPNEPVLAESVLRCIEALLMAADAPLSVDQIVRLLETTHALERADVRTGIEALQARYADSAMDLVEVASGWRFQVGADYSSLVARLWEERPPKLSRAMLETLALICYRQPIARSDIEAVRGVSVSSNIVKTLQEFGWIKVVGYRDMPGRPALFGTTPQFLDDFGVTRLSDLPSLPEIQDLDALDAALARLQSDNDADLADDAHADQATQSLAQNDDQPPAEADETSDGDDGADDAGQQAGDARPPD
ncbi:chromosome segregation and condensation protein ScpB [Salinisphaera sp. S4-8]|uniref:SMC-Scp complex subunit ScpB n=1 Tax=Salinisphaera sp. S4-8 TaxID=633357 RepID=UPI003341FA2A